MQKITFNKNTFNFRDIIEPIFNEKLENLHEEHKVFNLYTDTSSNAHKRFYGAIHDTDFFKVYKKFIKEMVVIDYNEPMLYQTMPSFRIHFSGNLAVGEYHKDSTYNHSTEEKNVYLPLTASKNTATVWVEDAIGSENYYPMNADYGDFVIWDGANLKHGNEINTTGKSRVSLDFRFIPKRLYKKSNKKSINAGKLFNIGEYWTELN